MSPGDSPFRKAVLRGLAVLVPPLLTIVIFLWVGNAVNEYVLQPVTTGIREVVYLQIADIRHDIETTAPDQKTVMVDGVPYRRLSGETFVPLAVYDKVAREQGQQAVPESAGALYRRYIDLTYLRPYYVIPAFLSIFVLLLYLLGKFMAAGIGRFFWNLFEQGINRLPLVRNVYSSVKQVSDFLFSETNIEYTRVVAVEYPRKGIWSLGFVTGESLADIRGAANEPVLSVLMCTSPMPMTGFTVTVRKSETLDLNITIEQAFQFIVSCGVVVPPQQLQEALANGQSRRLEAGPASDDSANGDSPDAGSPAGRADEKPSRETATAESG